MRRHNIMIYHFQYKKKENHPKFSEICTYGILSKGLENEFETALVNESSVFEPLKSTVCVKTETVILILFVKYNVTHIF